MKDHREIFIINFLFDVQKAAKNDGILVNSKYDNFREELGYFQSEYNVEFENSEGSERLISLMYAVRTYLNIEWKEIYEKL